MDYAVCCYRERFWENLTTPLFGTLTPPSDTTEVYCSTEQSSFH